MSDSFLRLIPEQPEFASSAEAGQTAIGILKVLMPSAAAVNTHVFQEIRFVDPGINFERVLCPHCREVITDHWSGWMDDSSKSRFTQRRIVLPCCKKESDLSDLVYEWPAGFTRFVLEIENPKPAEWLPSEVHKREARTTSSGYPFK
jgi:hypothetical protein